MLLIGTVISCEESLAPVHKQNNVWDVLLVFFFVIISLIWMNVCLAMDLRLELRVFRETHSPDSCWTIQVPHFSHEGLHYSAGTRFPLVENRYLVSSAKFKTAVSSFVHYIVSDMYDGQIMLN